MSLCILSGLSLQAMGQLLVLLVLYKQDRESLSAISLGHLCRAGLTPWSVSFPMHRTILNIKHLCKVMFLGPVFYLQVVYKVNFNEVLFLLNRSKQDQEC